MPATTLRIRVNPASARAYREASDADRRKLDLLLDLHLREATQQPESLATVMREIAAAARARGLTPDDLPGLLADD